MCYLLLSINVGNAISDFLTIQNTGGDCSAAQHHYCLHMNPYKKDHFDLKSSSSEPDITEQQFSEDKTLSMLTNSTIIYQNLDSE